MRVNKVFFRADASPEIGSGHFKRLLIIADELAERFKVSIVFLSCDLSDQFKKELANRQYELIEILPKNEKNQIIKLVKKQESKVLITDTDLDLYYQKDFQKKIVSFCKLVTITFFSSKKFYSHIIHNQNARASELTYDCASYTKKLLGLKYVILHKDFRKTKNTQSKDRSKLKLMISFGGADSKGFSMKVIKALKPMRYLLEEVNIIAGALNKEIDSLKAEVENASLPLKLYINTNQMASLMANSDVAITSGGLTSWELAALNVSNIIIPTSERERLTAEYLKKKFGLFCIWNEDEITFQLNSFLSRAIKNPLLLKNPLSEVINVDGIELFCEEIEKLILDDE